MTTFKPNANLQPLQLDDDHLLVLEEIWTQAKLDDPPTTNLDSQRSEYAAAALEGVPYGRRNAICLKLYQPLVEKVSTDTLDLGCKESFDDWYRDLIRFFQNCGGFTS